MIDRQARELLKGILLISSGVSASFGLVNGLARSNWVPLVTGVGLAGLMWALSQLLQAWRPSIIASCYLALALGACLVGGLEEGGIQGQTFVATSLLVTAGSFFYGIRGALITSGGALTVGAVLLWHQAARAEQMPTLSSIVAGMSVPLASFALAAFGGTFMHVMLGAVTRRLEAQQYDLQRSAALLETEVKLRTHAQQELARAYHSVVEEAGLKSAFLANMSHELRTPMNAVVGLTDLLLREELTPNQRENLETVQESSQGLLVLLDDLLDLSKIEAGAMRLDTLDFGPRDVVVQLERLLTARAKSKDIALVFHCEDNVPPMLKGDPLRLTQILTNLIGNSLKFTERGRVGVSLRWEDSILTVKVTDTGIGMNADQMSALFQPFSQADNSMTRRFGGTGLGLAIVKRLCELHGGDVSVKSELGVGSEFIATLRCELGEPQKNRRASSSLKPVEPIEGLHVLIVEDNIINQRVAERMLARLGATYAIAQNGAEAVTAVEREPWDIVLMDLQMPVMDGFEATRRIRASSVRQPVIIALSANAMEEDRAAARNAGVDNFLAKPITLDALAEALQRGRTVRHSAQANTAEVA